MQCLHIHLDAKLFELKILRKESQTKMFCQVSCIIHLKNYVHGSPFYLLLLFFLCGFVTINITYILHGHFNGIGAIIRKEVTLKWVINLMNLQESLCIYIKTLHNKTMCIFCGIYCTSSRVLSSVGHGLQTVITQNGPVGFFREYCCWLELMNGVMALDCRHIAIKDVYIGSLTFRVYAAITFVSYAHNRC